MRRLYPFRANLGKILLATAFAALIGGAYVVLDWTAAMEALVVHEQRLRNWIDSRAVIAFFLGLGIYTAVSFIPGTSGKAIAIGWLYGFWKGIVLVEIGLSTAAMVTFLISRYVLRDVIRSRYAVFLHRLERKLVQRAAVYALSLRLAHVPYTILNYAWGATTISLRTFLWTTVVGMLPGTVVFVFAGVRLPTLAELAKEGAWGLLDAWLLAALALSAVAVPVARLVLRWHNRRSASADRRLQESKG